MNGFGFSELNPMAPGDWPWLPRSLLVVVVIALAAVIGYLAWFGERYREIAIERQRAEELRASLPALMAQRQAWRMLERRLVEIGDELVAADGTLSATLLPALLDDLERTADERDVRIDSIRLPGGAANRFHRLQPIDLELTGSFAGLAGFIEAMGELPHWLTVGDFELSSREEQTLRLVMRLEAYHHLVGADS